MKVRRKLAVLLIFAAALLMVLSIPVSGAAKTYKSQWTHSNGNAGRVMKSILEPLKDVTIRDKVITIKTTMTPENEAELKELAQEYLDL